MTAIYVPSQISDLSNLAISLISASAGRHPALAKWFDGGYTNKKIAFLGDSTTDNANNFFYGRMFNVTLAYSGGGAQALSGYWASAYGPFYGMTMADDRDSTTSPSRPANFSATNIINLGHNGQSLATWLSTQAAAESALAADLYVFCYGINDVRTGATTQSQMVTMLRQSIALLKKNSPNCCIILMEPNSFLADDPGSSGYVTVGSYGSLALASQAYTDILHNAYVTVAADKTEGVVLLETQSTIFGRTVRPSAQNGLMGDILHPNFFGQQARADALTRLIGISPAYSQGAADAARAASYSAPYLSYARACEDSEYWYLINSGRVSAGQYGTTYIDTDMSGFRASEIRAGDIIALEGLPSVVLTGSAGSLANGTVQGGTRIIQSNTIPAGWFGSISIYRHKFRGDPTFEQYMRQTLTYPYKWRGTVQGGGNGYLIVNALPGELGSLSRTALAAGDTLIGFGKTPQLLTGATFTSFSGQLRINVGFDFSTWAAGMSVLFVGNHAYENGDIYQRFAPSLPWLQIN